MSLFSKSAEETIVQRVVNDQITADSFTRIGAFIEKYSFLYVPNKKLIDGEVSSHGDSIDRSFRTIEATFVLFHKNEGHKAIEIYECSGKLMGEFTLRPLFLVYNKELDMWILAYPKFTRLADSQLLTPSIDDDKGYCSNWWRNFISVGLNALLDAHHHEVAHGDMSKMDSFVVQGNKIKVIFFSKNVRNLHWSQTKTTKHEDIKNFMSFIANNAQCSQSPDWMKFYELAMWDRVEINPHLLKHPFLKTAIERYYYYNDIYHLKKSLEWREKRKVDCDINKMKDFYSWNNKFTDNSFETFFKQESSRYTDSSSQTHLGPQSPSETDIEPVDLVRFLRNYTEHAHEKGFEYLADSDANEIQIKVDCKISEHYPGYLSGCYNALAMHSGRRV